VNEEQYYNTVTAKQICIQTYLLRQFVFVNCVNALFHLLHRDLVLYGVVVEVEVEHEQRKGKHSLHNNP
jgi:hypothetical protein